MTRFLSESLQAPEPFFRLGLRRLERANGGPNTDIRFSTEVQHSARAKIHEIGLDSRDTTAEELYHALQLKIEADDAKLVKNFRTQAATYISAEGDVVAGMVHALNQLPDSKRCFALKNSSLKAIIKKLPPKKAMKRLGYRSVESFLKHESVLSVLAAAWLCEGKTWQGRLLEQYKKLKPSDFENRNITVVQFDQKRWQELASQVVVQKKHNILCFKELGCLIIFPLGQNAPAGSVTVSTSLALHEMNEIRASSTLLKLCQVRSDFGQIVQRIASDDAAMSTQLLDQPVQWSLIQRYYAHMTDLFREELFEPHIQLEDMVWHPVEKTLSSIEPAFKFWHNSGHLGLLHEKKPISLNLVDAALNYCNNLGLEHRVSHYFQRSLWHELLLRYLQRGPVEQSILAEIQPELATEKVMA